MSKNVILWQLTDEFLEEQKSEVFGRYLEAVHHSMTTVTLVGEE